MVRGMEFKLLNSVPCPSPTIYKSGSRAYIDTVQSGLIPCRVLSVDKPGNGWESCSGAVTVKVLPSAKGAFNPGLVCSFSAATIVPARQVKRRKYSTRILTGYRWE